MNLEGDQERSGLEPVERETRERYPWLLHSCLIGVCDVPILVPPPSVVQVLEQQSSYSGGFASLGQGKVAALIQ